MTPLETITAVGGVTKGIAEIAKSVKNVELNQKVIDLQQLIFELQGQLADLQQENLEQRERIRELEKKKNLESRLFYAESVYWLRGEADGEERIGPFCPTCFDTKQQLVRLRPTAQAGFYRCNAHKGAFRTAEYKGSDDGDESGFAFWAGSSASR
jgi:hypothetical protein